MGVIVWTWNKKDSKMYFISNDKFQLEKNNQYKIIAILSVKNIYI